MALMIARAGQPVISNAMRRAESNPRNFFAASMRLRQAAWKRRKSKLLIFIRKIGCGGSMPPILYFSGNVLTGAELSHYSRRIEFLVGTGVCLH